MPTLLVRIIEIEIEIENTDKSIAEEIPAPSAFFFLLGIGLIIGMLCASWINSHEDTPEERLSGEDGDEESDGWEGFRYARLACLKHGCCGSVMRVSGAILEREALDISCVICERYNGRLVLGRMRSVLDL